MSEPKRCVIKTDGTNDGTTVLLDGKDLGNVLYAFKVAFDVRDTPRVELHIYELNLELTTDDVNVYKACANCERELNAPPNQGTPPKEDAPPA